jgi:glycopeptide antibiotics resistance protein
LFNNTFLTPAIILVAIAIPVWFIARVAFRKRIPGLTISFAREFLYFIFFLYIIALAAVTIVPLSYALHRVPGADDTNLIPFKSTIHAIRHSMAVHKPFRLSMLFENTPGNIVLFLPMGFLLPLIAKRTDSFWGILLTGLFCSAGIEFIQYIERNFGVYRSVDIDDVILNTLGAVTGWIILCLSRSLFGIKNK